MPDELEAVVAAARTGGTIFAYLDVGARFTFSQGETAPVYTKHSKSFYGFVSLRKKWRCAPRATVYAAPDRPPAEIAA